MPTYDFECTPCSFVTEIKQGINDPDTHVCPVCEQKTLRKVFLTAPSFFVRGEPTTIGQLSERNKDNAKRANDEIQKSVSGVMSKEAKEKRETYQKINSMTKEQKIQWIEKGD